MISQCLQIKLASIKFISLDWRIYLIDLRVRVVLLSLPRKLFSSFSMEEIFFLGLPLGLLTGVAVILDISVLVSTFFF